MTVLSNYIFRQVWTTTLAMTFGLALLVLLTQSLRFLDLMISAGAAPSVFFKLLALSLPRLVEVVLPIALAVSTLMITLKLQGDQELTVMQATGASNWRLARPVWAAAMLTSALLATLTFWLTPLSISTLQSQRQVIQAQFSLSLLQPGVFNFFGDDIMVYFDRRDDEGRLVNLILHDQRDKEKPYTLLAQRGELLSDGQTYRLNITDGRRQQLNVRAGAIDQLSFTQYAIKLPKTIRDIAPRWKEPEERTLFELLARGTSAADVKNRQGLNAELHRRLALPLLPLTLAISVVGLALRSVRPRRGMLMPLAIGLTAIGIIQAVFLIAVTSATENPAAIACVYGAVLVPLLWSTFKLKPLRAQRLKRSMA